MNAGELRTMAERVAIVDYLLLTDPSPVTREGLLAMGFDDNMCYAEFRQGEWGKRWGKGLIRLLAIFECLGPKVPPGNRVTDWKLYLDHYDDEQYLSSDLSPRTLGEVRQLMRRLGIESKVPTAAPIGVQANAVN